MKTTIQILLTALTLLACLPHAKADLNAYDTMITYQGFIANQLDHGTNTLDDFAFTLFSTNSGGSPVAGPITNTAVAVNSNGLFTTTMDFGANAIWGPGAQIWLEIGVRTNGGGAF